MNPPSPVNSISPASIFANRPSSAPEAASSAAAREPSASARSARRSALVGLPLISVLMVVVTVIMIPSLGTITHTDHLTRPRVRIALLITQMIRQLDLQATLQRRLDQPSDEPAIAGQLDLSGVDLREQAIQRPRGGQLRRRPRTLRVGPVGSTLGLGRLTTHLSPHGRRHSDHDPFTRNDHSHRPSDTPAGNGDDDDRQRYLDQQDRKSVV